MLSVSILNFFIFKFLQLLISTSIFTSDLTSNLIRTSILNFNLQSFTLDQPSTAQQVAQAAAPIAAAAAISPPPLNMFPPQGAPQPGAVSAGGGVTPAVALTVRKV